MLDDVFKWQLFYFLSLSPRGSKSKNYRQSVNDLMYYSAKEFHAKIMKHCTDLKNNNSANEMFSPHHNFSHEYI